MVARLVAIITGLLLSIFIAGCGGGTRGTGVGGNSDVSIAEIPAGLLRGVVLDENGFPARGVSLTLLETGDTASTDVNGEFELYFEVPENKEVLLEIKTGGKVFHSEILGESSILNLEISLKRKVVTINEEGTSTEVPLREG